MSDKFDNSKVEQLFVIFFSGPGNLLDSPLVCFRVGSPINPAKILDDYAEWGDFDRAKLRYDMIPMIEYKGKNE